MFKSMIVGISSSAIKRTILMEHEEWRTFEWAGVIKKLYPSPNYAPL